MKIKALDNILEIFFVSIKAPFYTPGLFAVVVEVFKLREFFLTITDIKSAFRHI